MGSAETGPQRRRPRKPFFESAALLSWTLVLDAGFVATAFLILRLSLLRCLALHVAVVSAITLLVFGLDKWRSRRESRRVSVTNLLILSAVGGALGGALGMAIFRHKT